MKSDCIFSYNGYRNFLRHGLSNGDAVTFAGAVEKGFILRHDIDIELGQSLRLAEVEAELGVRATYFVLLSAETYNPLSPTGRDLVSQISRMHDIGLHFDPTVYPDATLDELGVHARREAALLEQIVRRPVVCLAPHNPSVHGLMAPIPGFINAYEPRFFEDRRYLSDARMEFRGKDPMSFIELAATDLIQISLHPEHFAVEQPTYADIFKRHSQEMLRNWDGHFRPVNPRFVESWPEPLENLLR